MTSRIPACKHAQIHVKDQTCRCLLQHFHSAATICKACITSGGRGAIVWARLTVGRSALPCLAVALLPTLPGSPAFTVAVLVAPVKDAAAAAAAVACFGVRNRFVGVGCGGCFGLVGRPLALHKVTMPVFMTWSLASDCRDCPSTASMEMVSKSCFTLAWNCSWKPVHALMQHHPVGTCLQRNTSLQFNSPNSRLKFYHLSRQGSQGRIQSHPAFSNIMQHGLLSTRNGAMLSCK